MTKKSSATLIGLFTLIGIIIAGLSLVILGAGKFFEKNHRVQLYFEKSVYGLQVGSDVRFGGVRIGRVSSISVIIDTTENRKVIPVVVELTEKQLEKISGEEGGMIDFTSQEGIRNAVGKGLRAGMKQESLVTGQLYVEFDIVPNAEGFVYESKVQAGDPVVPTIPTEIDELISGISDGLKKIIDLDLDGMINDIRVVIQSFNSQMAQLELKRINDNLVGLTDDIRGITGNHEIKNAAKNLNTALDELKKLSMKLNNGVDPLLADVETMTTNANQTLKKIEEAALELSKVGDPRSPVLLDLKNLVHETQITSRALKELTGDLRRNPNTLLRGKKSSQ